MQARIRNPAIVLPDTLQGINALYKAVHTAGVPRQVLELVHLRASQINGCSPCVVRPTWGAPRSERCQRRCPSSPAGLFGQPSLQQLAHSSRRRSCERLVTMPFRRGRVSRAEVQVRQDGVPQVVAVEPGRRHHAI